VGLFGELEGFVSERHLVPNVSNAPREDKRRFADLKSEISDLKCAERAVRAVLAFPPVLRQVVRLVL